MPEYPNLAETIERRADGKAILAVEIRADEDADPKVYDWATGRQLLDVAFDDGGWNGPRAPMLIAWTEERVIFTDEYDSSTSISWLPRNPRR